MLSSVADIFVSDSRCTLLFNSKIVTALHHMLPLFLPWCSLVLFILGSPSEVRFFVRYQFLIMTLAFLVCLCLKLQIEMLLSAIWMRSPRKQWPPSLLLTFYYRFSSFYVRSLFYLGCQCYRGVFLCHPYYYVRSCLFCFFVYNYATFSNSFGFSGVATDFFCACFLIL